MEREKEKESHSAAIRTQGKKKREVSEIDGEEEKDGEQATEGDGWKRKVGWGDCLQDDE